MKFFVVIFFLLISSWQTANFKNGPACDSEANRATSSDSVKVGNEAIMARAASLAVPFVRNTGQFNAEVRYSADLFSGRFFLTEGEMIYSLTMRSTRRGKNAGEKILAFSEYFAGEKGEAIHFKPLGEGKGTAKISYFRGNDPAKWRSGYYPSDVFISKLNGNLARLLASTYLSEKGRDEGNSLAVGRSGAIFLTGVTESEDFPTTPRAIDRKFDGYIARIQGEAFVSRLDKDLQKLPASTFIPDCAPYSCLRGEAISLDGFDYVYVTGSNMQDVWPDNLCGMVFVCKVNQALTKLLSKSCLGELPGLNRILGSGKSLALDRGGSVYVTGVPAENFPTTKGAFDRTFHGIFVTKLNGSEIGITLGSPDGGEIWMAGTTHDITWETSGAIARVKIRLSLDHGDSWSDVTAATGNDGHFPWTVSGNLSNQCLVQVSDADYPIISDASDSVFSIVNAPPQVEITSPANNATVFGSVAVKATATDNIAVVRAEFYVDGVLMGKTTARKGSIPEMARKGISKTRKDFQETGNRL